MNGRKVRGAREKGREILICKSLMLFSCSRSCYVTFLDFSLFFPAIEIKVVVAVDYGDGNDDELTLSLTAAHRDSIQYITSAAATEAARLAATESDQ